jgi:RNA polymerase sigma factor (sigma-70 family)
MSALQTTALAAAEHAGRLCKWTDLARRSHAGIRLRCRAAALVLVHNIYVSDTSDLISMNISQAPATAQAGDAYLYDQTVQRVHAIVRRYVKDDGAAQEVTEDVFFMAWSQAHRFDAARGSVLAWLLTIARSKGLDTWRQHAARWVHFDSQVADDQLAQLPALDTPSDILQAMDQHCAVHAALKVVSPAARQMISLAFFQGMTHTEISTHLQTPLGTVKTTIRRALTMRDVLQAHSGSDAALNLTVEE